MEEPLSQPAMPSILDPGQSANLTATNDGEMDIDIDMDPIETDIPMDDLTAHYTESISKNPLNASNNITFEPISAHKIHIRGVDDLTTEDLKAFSAEHFPSGAPLRIEWIDDTSANIVFNTPSAALDALRHFSSNSIDDVSHAPLQLRAGKSFTSHPELNLQVRMALVTDQKQPRAYEASRFYMMHPEHDPREQRRRDRSSHKGYNEYQRRKYKREEHRRRKEIDDREGFSANMYDDDSGTSFQKKPRKSSLEGSFSSRSSISSSDVRRISKNRYRSQNLLDSYRPEKSGRNKSLRNRSASPEWNGDSQQSRLVHFHSSRTPPSTSPLESPAEYIKNSGIELFPSMTASGARNLESSTSKQELFPNKSAATNLKRELFPNKSAISNHRRTGAFDAADETADLFSNGLHLPFENGFKSHENPKVKPRSSVASTYGRLKDSDPEPESLNTDASRDNEFSIRGASTSHGSGFAIRGTASNDTHRVGTVKELFPGKASGNLGKELFAEKIQGRGGRRNKAEDMFY